MELVIKGIVYFESELNHIIIPVHTGFFNSVDCEAYITEEEMILKGYSEDYRNSNKENYITRDGVKYFYTGYTPYHIDDDWQILSDISGLVFNDDVYDFYNN